MHPISVRGMPIKRIKSVSVLGNGEALTYHGRCPILDQLYNPDPLGELTISVPAVVIDEDATVIVIEIEESK
jgi:alpha-L-fucosidase